MRRSVWPRRLAGRVLKPQTLLQGSPRELDYRAASLRSALVKTSSIGSARSQSIIASCRPIRGLSKAKRISSICCEWPRSEDGFERIRPRKWRATLAMTIKLDQLRFERTYDRLQHLRAHILTVTLRFSPRFGS